MHRKQEQESLSEKIYSFNTLQQEYIAKRLKEQQLNVQHARCLNYIGAHAGTNQKMLASYLNKQEATVTNIVKVLEKKQLIRRVTTSGNERQKELYLTSLGEEMTQSIHKIFIDLDTVIDTIIPSSDRQDAMRILDYLNQKFSKVN